MSNENSDVFLFEIAWEVANKVGGIYTVIRSKAPVLTKKYNSNFAMLGLYSPKFATTEVEFIPSPTSTPIAKAIKILSDTGIKVHFGKWLIDGYPQIILFDLDSAYCNIDSWRYELAQYVKCDLPVFDKECSDVIVFGGLVAWFLFEIRNQMAAETTIIAHFHEWLTSVGLIFLKIRNVQIATIFTTHATILGRYLAASNTDLYNNLPHFNPDYEAGKRMIYHKYRLEKEAALCAHVFTTVSEITAEESTHFLHRKPDIVTPNGLQVKKYIALHEFQNLHALSKAKINNFILGHFAGNYDFDLDKTIYFFNAGRYEFTNKGIDLYIDALARLNHLLKWYEVDVTVIAFLIFPTSTNNYNVESLKGQALIKQLRESVSELQNKIGTKILEQTSKGHLPDTNELIESEDIIKLKRYLVSSNRGSWPPICTHNVTDDANDRILCALRQRDLINKPQDRVKVIFHPEFLNSSNPLFSIDYEEFVRGCHLGVFCSYYEPWGYTPAECTVMGIPSVTSNLSGFGQYISSIIDNSEAFGIYIIDRRTISYNESVDELSMKMLKFTQQNRKQRIMQRNRTERLSDLLDWKKLENFYNIARDLSLYRFRPDQFSDPNIESKTNKKHFGKMLRTMSIQSLQNPFSFKKNAEFISSRNSNEEIVRNPESSSSSLSSGGDIDDFDSFLQSYDNPNDSDKE